MILRGILFLAVFLAGCAGTTGPTPIGPPVEEAVRLDTPTGTIHGTLLLPGAATPHPLVLIHAGSGPTDRNGNSAGLGANNSLKLLAEALADRGIASVRYDKRGIAASGAAAMSESELRFESYVDDAAEWIRQLRGDARFRTITVVGHSEGSLIGMLAAEQARADGFVSVAGPAQRASDLLRDQLRRQLTPEFFQEADRVLVELEQGRTVADVPAWSAMLFRASVQPYLISWFRYVPAEEIRRLQAPVLIVFGTTDIQVGVGEADAFRAARPEAEVVLIEGMNHVLKMVPADPARQIASYSDPTLPVAPLLVERVAGFVGGVQRRR